MLNPRRLPDSIEVVPNACEYVLAQVVPVLVIRTIFPAAYSPSDKYKRLTINHQVYKI